MTCIRAGAAVIRIARSGQASTINIGKALKLLGEVARRLCDHKQGDARYMGVLLKC